MLTENKIKEILHTIESDERMAYKTANVQTNAPLALIQYGMECKSDILRKVLELPPLDLNKLRNEKP